MYQQAIGQVAEKGLSPEVRAPHRETIESYVGQLEANAEQTVKQIEELRGQVLKLEGEAAESVPKAALERVEEEAAGTKLRLETEMAQLREQLATAESEENPRVVALKEKLEQLGKARQEAVGSLEEMSHEATVPKATFEEAQRRVEALELEMAELAARLEKASGEENPRVVALKEQIAQLGTAHEQATLKQQQVIEQLEADVERLTLAAKEHPREIEEITRRAEGEAEKAAALQVEMRRYQEVALEVAQTPHGKVAALLEETGRQHAEIVGDSTQEQADKAFLTHKIHLLEAKQAEHEAIQKNLEAAHRTGAEEALRSPDVAVVGEIIKALTELHRTTEEALADAREEHRVLDQVAELEHRNEPGIELALNKVRSLESQVASLRASIETYQTSGANQILPDVQLLQNLISLVPESSRGEVVPYLMHAVAAVAAIQQTLTREFGAEGVHHSRIEGLLQQIYTWNGEYLDITDSSVAALRGGARDVLSRSLRCELPTILQAIVGYMQMPAANIEGEIVAKRATIDQLNLAHGQLDAVHDDTRNEDEIGANRVEFTIESIYLNTLLAIQGVHQPLRDAHAAEKTDLEWQKTVLGTMQRLIVGFFSMISSIPGMMIGGLQTMGHPLVGKK